MRDDGFRHLEDTERDDLQATQKIVARRSTKLGNNHVAESGIIESIECLNFMCHERLHVELGPLINFIVGENGSGKSAVLTALTLCLGGKASDTNRGGSLRSFVKEGRDSGCLIVKIKNAGTDAYQPDIYGDTIIVERHFSKTGSSGFKIKSATGKVISTKKQEVDEISEWYALQMGNPLTVLSQDNARQFLNAATPAQKYKYFVSGVQLEQLDNDYKMSQDTLDKTLILRDDLNERIEQVKKDMEEAQRLSDTASKNQSLREKQRLYRHQLAWSQVVEQERELERRNKDLEERDRRIEESQQQCETMTAALTTIDEKLEQFQEARRALDEEDEGYNDRIAAAEVNVSEATKRINELLVEERDAHARLKRAKKEAKTLKDNIEQETQRLSDSTGPERAQKDSQLAEAHRREKEIKEGIAEATESVPALTAAREEAEKQRQIVDRAKAQKKQEILDANKRVRELQESGGGPLDGFDREMHHLVKTIQDEGGFSHKPMGPLGAHVRLLKPEWSGILEKTFGDGLNAFVVRNKQDQTRLASMMRRLGMKKPPQIFIAYGNNIDTRAQEPDDGFDTILRILEFDEDLVRTQLIINYQIEKIILVKERVEAERIMFDDRPPRNVSACLTFHDGQGKRGHGLRITNRGGNTGTSPIQPSPMRPRMQTDSSRQLALQTDHVRHLATEMRETEAEYRQSKQALDRADTALKQNRQRLGDLENDLRRAQAEIESIQYDLDAFEGADDRLQALRRDLEAKEEELDQFGNQYGAMNVTKQELEIEVNAAKQKLKDEQTSREDYQNRLNKANGKIKSQNDIRRIALGKKNDAYERLDIEKHERRRAEEKRDQQRSQVEDFARQASEMAPERVHIPEGETFQSIEQKYKKLKDQLAQREKRLGASDQEIHNRAAEAKRRYDDVMKQTRDVDDTIASLKRAIESRLHLWRQFQRQISARVRIQFAYLLSERGFRGRIDLNHRQRQVVLNVEPDETRKSSVGRSTKTLSGGEKSFSSICMLLSIWEAIGSPIRCLDEFDVFMDNVNRAISTNMLVSFFLLTS
jgi:chromosome segregation ATPase